MERAGSGFLFALFLLSAAALAALVFQPSPRPIPRGRRAAPAPPAPVPAAAGAPARGAPGGRPAPPLQARFEGLLAAPGSDPAETALAGLVAADARAIELVLSDPGLAGSLALDLVTVFPGRSGLADRLLAVLGRSPEEMDARMFLGDPGAMASYLSGENRVTALLDTILGGRPAGLEEAWGAIRAMEAQGVEAWSVGRARALLDAGEPRPADPGFLPYHAFFHRLACTGPARGERGAVLAVYYERHGGDLRFTAGPGRAALNLCQVLAERGSHAALGGVVDLVSRPRVRVVPAPARGGDLVWSLVPDDDAEFWVAAYQAERLLERLTARRGDLGAALREDAATGKLARGPEAESARAAWRAWWRVARAGLAWDGARFVPGTPPGGARASWERLDASFDLRAERERELRKS